MHPSGGGSAEPPKLILVGRYGPPALGLSGARATARGSIRPAPRERARNATLTAAAAVIVIAAVAAILSGVENQGATVRQTTISTIDAQVLHRFPLSAGSGNAAARGRAAIARQGQNLILLVEGGGLLANHADVYAVWLEGPADAARLLGLISPPVTAAGTFSTGATLPSNASSYTTVLITRETTSAPAQPGTPVLAGRLPRGLSR